MSSNEASSGKSNILQKEVEYNSVLEILHNIDMGSGEGLCLADLHEAENGLIQQTESNSKI